MSNAIQEARSIEQIVSIINDQEGSEYFGGTDLRTPEAMAGEYAYNAAEEQCNTEDDNIEANLYILADFGAEFDFYGAIEQSKLFKTNN